MPFVMAVGIGLSVRNAKAVLEAIFGVKSISRARRNTTSKAKPARWRKNLSQSRRLDAVSGNRARPVFRGDDCLRDPERKLRHRAVPVACSFGVILYTGFMSGQQVRPAATGAPGF
jgi:hypothetical protein